MKYHEYTNVIYYTIKIRQIKQNAPADTPLRIMAPFTVQKRLNRS